MNDDARTKTDKNPNNNASRCALRSKINCVSDSGRNEYEYGNNAADSNKGFRDVKMSLKIVFRILPDYQ